MGQSWEKMTLGDRFQPELFHLSAASQGEKEFLGVLHQQLLDVHLMLVLYFTHWTDLFKFPKTC